MDTTVNILEITQKNFDTVIAKNDLILIDFWAQWCEPCKAFAKVIQKIAPKYPKFTFASIDIDSEKELANEFQIRSVPAIMILRKSNVVFAESGLLGPAALEDLLKQAKALKPDQLK